MWKDYVYLFKNIRSKWEYKAINENAIIAAVNNAYNDAKRTMNGIGKVDSELKKAKENVIELLKLYFTGAVPENTKDFDKKHNEMCKAWQKEFSLPALKTYGKAQKIVNMSFKYLYCCEEDSKNDYFKYCHMPLDSIILEWFKREYNKTHIKKLTEKKINSWSNIQDTKGYYYEYGFYVDEIRKICNSLPDEPTVLQHEFRIWSDMQEKLAAEEFLLSLIGDEFDRSVKVRKKREVMGAELIENYRDIRNILDAKLSEFSK